MTNVGYEMHAPSAALQTCRSSAQHTVCLSSERYPDGRSVRPSVRLYISVCMFFGLSVGLLDLLGLPHYTYARARSRKIEHKTGN